MKRGLVNREAIQVTGAAGGDEIFLAAAARRVRGIPRCIAAAGAVEMTELGGARGAGSPVGAGVVGSIGISGAIGLRAGQNVVLVGGVAKAFDRFAFFREDGGFGDVRAEAGEGQRIAVQ